MQARTNRELPSIKDVLDYRRERRHRPAKRCRPRHHDDIHPENVTNQGHAIFKYCPRPYGHGTDWRQGIIDELTIIITINRDDRLSKGTLANPSITPDIVLVFIFSV